MKNEDDWNSSYDDDQVQVNFFHAKNLVVI